MKILFLGFILITFAFIFTPNLQAQWTRTNGPGGGSISSITSNGTSMFVSTGTYSGSGYGGGVYRSSDNGQSWTSLSYPITRRDDMNASSVSVSGSNVAVGSIGGVVYLSTDNGDNFTRNLIGYTNKNVTSIVNDGTQFFVATDQGGVYSIAFGASTFTPLNTGLTNQRVQALFLDNGTLYAATAFGTGSLFKSTDLGSSWSAITMPAGIFNAFSVGVFSNKIFVGGQNGVYTSTDGGTNWSNPSSGLSLAVYTFALVGSTVYAGNSNGIYSISLTGSSWTTVSSSNGATALFSSATGLFGGLTAQFGSVAKGVSLSTNGGTTWTDRSNGIAASTIHSMLVNGSSLFALSGSGIYVSTDEGNSWTLSNASAQGYDAQSQELAISNGKIFAPTSTGMVTSTDNGGTWVSSNPGFTPQAFYSFGSNVYAGENGGIRISTDNGVTWTQSNTGLTGYLSTNCFGNKGTLLFAGLYNAGFFVSTDSGASWTPKNTGLGSTRVRSIVVMGSKIIVATDGDGVYVSSDEGTSWTKKNIGVASNNIWSITEQSGTLFLASNNGVAYSLDSAGTWTPTISWPVITNGVIISNTNIFASTLANGVWKRNLSDFITEVNPSENSIPSTFSLNQNYPNPFNPSTTVSYTILKAGNVTLKIFDILGKEIATLLNETKQPGKYSILWDASKLSSGEYLYVLTATGDNSFTQTRKMILLK